MVPTNHGAPQPPQGYAGETPSPPPEQEPLPEKRHVHHSYIWLGSIRAALQTIITIFIIVFATVLGESMEGAFTGASNVALIIGVVVVISFVVIMALIVAVYVLSYRHLFYELGPEEFNLYSGVFSKKRVHVPYQRVQSVNQRTSLLQRLFGVCTLYIDTAGGSTNKSVLVPYVQNFEAERLRKEIFERKQLILTGQTVPSQAGAPSGVSRGVQPAASSAQTTNVLDTPADFIGDVRGVFGAAAVDTGSYPMNTA